MTAFLKDLRHAVRVLLGTKSWTAVVLVSLSLGIGANTALFTAVNGLLLERLPVPAPEALVRIKWTGDNDMVRSSSDYGFNAPDAGRRVRSTVSFAIYQQFRASNQTLVDLTAFAPRGQLNVVTDGQADYASGLEASGSYYRTLEIRAALGRTFTDDDDRLSASPVAVLSDAYWRRRFHADPTVLNRVISVNSQRVTIIGVTGPDLLSVQRLGASAPDLTIPLAFDGLLTSQTRLSAPTNWWLLTLGRLKPGITIDQVRGNLEGPFRAAARAGMDAYTAGLTASQRQLSSNRQRGNAVPTLSVSSGAHGVYDLDTTTERSAQFLSVVVAIVLLIVCANVANLLLSRATARQREISIRLSLGATRPRLVRQLLTESLLLSGLGGALGILVGYWSRGLLPFGKTAPIDIHVLAFVAGLCTLTGVGFGLVPALRATRVDLAGAMKESGRSVTSSRSLLAKTLLVAQVALSLVLLIGAGLFLRTLDNLRRVDVGFNPTNLLMFSVSPRLNGYDSPRMLALYDQLHDKLAALPGARSVALTASMMLSGNTSSTDVFSERETSDKPTLPDMYVMSVTPEFFDTMGIGIVAGRGFTDRDGPTAPKVVLINQTAARALYPGENPVGRHLGESIEDKRDYEIVGVLRDTKYSSIRDAVPPTMYTCSRQGTQSGMAFVIRTAADPNALSDAVRTTVRQMDATLPLSSFTTQEDQLEQRFAQERLFATAYSLFGGLALLLACIGLFGLMSYNVARRTNEIGIRMALGAQRSTVVRMVLLESLALVAIGVAVGLGSAGAAGHLVKTVLYGLTPTDAATFVTAVTVVVAVSILAGYLPARRASRVDPMIALHRQ
jgi:predicted permease